MTRILSNQRWRCDYCASVLLEPSLLTAPSPFDSDDVLVGCPNCKQTSDGFTLLCDEEGCNSAGTSGFPTEDDNDQYGGYRNACHKHSKWDKENG